MGFNRNILGCKEKKGTDIQKMEKGFNRNILGCKVSHSSLNFPAESGFNRNILGCKEMWLLNTITKYKI